MAGFYNRTGGRTFVDGSGAHPIDVVEYGGEFIATASPANNTSAQILAAAPSGFMWRLHSWGWGLSQGLAANNGQSAFLKDGLGGIDGFLTVYPATTTLAAGGRPLGGQLTSGPVTVTGLLGGTVPFFLRYDQVLFPVIT